MFLFSERRELSYVFLSDVYYASSHIDGYNKTRTEIQLRFNLRVVKFVGDQKHNYVCSTFFTKPN